MPTVKFGEAENLLGVLMKDTILGTALFLP
jgi:hypothetical protein